MKNPPNYALRFLARFCPDELFEGIEGDLLEQFDKDVVNHGIRSARRRFTWNVLRFFRPGIFLRNHLKFSVTPIGMIRSYFILGIRNILKQKTSSLINLTGITIAVTFFILTALFVSFEVSYDKFHSHYKSIYHAETVTLKDGAPDPSSIGYQFPVPFQPLIKANAGGIELSTRFTNWEMKIIKGSAVLPTNVHFADPDFLKMFTIDFIYGSKKTALDAKSGVVLCESLARKIFDDTEVVGKTVMIGKELRTVTGVYRDLPDNSSLQFVALMPLEKFPPFLTLSHDQNDWYSRYCHLFVQFNGTTESPLKQLAAIVTANFPKPERKAETPGIILKPLDELHFDLHSGFDTSSNALYSYILGGLSLVILLTACINYTLLSLATQVKRSVEVGIRKVSGASSSNIRWQFFGEMQLIIGIAIPASLMTAYLLLPVFNRLTGKNLRLAEGLSPVMLMILFGVVILTGVTAALYPAIVLSRSSPQQILKINASVKYKATMGNYLMVFQFASCFALMIFSMVMYQQMNYVQNKDLGFKGDQIIMVSTLNTQGIKSKVVLDRFRNDLANRTEIKSLSALGFNFGALPMATSSTDSLGKEHQRSFTFVDYDFFEMLQAKLVDGRYFNKKSGDDSAFNFVINESLARDLNRKNIIGSSLDDIGSGSNDTPSIIIGVVKDFNFQPLDKAIAPMAFGLSKRDFQKIMVKADKDKIPEAIALLEKTWKSVASDSEFTYSFLDDDIQKQYGKYYQWLSIIAWSSGLGIFIACLGMFGLTGLLVVNRTKEIGIRRVLGASAPNILLLLSRRYVWLILLSFVIAAPAAYYYANVWLSNFAYHITLQYSVFIIPVFVIMGMSLFIIVVQSMTTVRRNPTESLRCE